MIAIASSAGAPAAPADLHPLLPPAGPQSASDSASGMDTRPGDPPAVDSALESARAQSRQEARVVQEVFPAAIVAAIAGKHLKTAVTPSGCLAYLEKLRADCDNSMNPIEQMLIEQQAWAHLRIADLHVEAASTDKPQLAVAYSQAAAGLMNEFRKTALALKEMRKPAGPKQVTFVAGNQQVAMVDTVASAVENGLNDDTKLGTNQEQDNHAGIGSAYTTTDRREVEPLQTQRVNGRGASKAPRRRADKPSMAVFNGASDRGG